jgi:hypothetical protein
MIDRDELEAFIRALPGTTVEEAINAFIPEKGY